MYKSQASVFYKSAIRRTPTCSLLTEKRKSRSEESNSSTKRSAKQNYAKKTKQASGNSNFSKKGVSQNNPIFENFSRENSEVARFE